MRPGFCWFLMCDAKLIAALILVWPQNIILLPARVFRNIIVVIYTDRLGSLGTRVLEPCSLQEDLSS